MYKYNIVYFDEGEDKEIEYNGIIAAKTFSEAVERLSAEFGEKSISKISLVWLSDDPYIIFTNIVEDISNMIEKID